MKILKRISLLLLVCMLVPMMFSCAQKNTEIGQQHEEGYYDGSSRERTPDTLPDDFNLKGRRVGVLYAAHSEKSVIGDDEIIDIVYSKIYERNLNVRNRLNVDLQFVSSDTTEWQQVTGVISNRIYLQDDTDQIIMTTNNTVVQEKLFNYFHDLNDSEWIDINEEWYAKDSIMELSVDYYYYRFIYGDININCLGNAGVIFYNKDLYEQYINPANRDYLYDLVMDGQWTMDQFYSLTKKSHIQKGGNGENDIHGYSLFRVAEPIHLFAASCDVTYYTRARNGIPVIAINNEHAIDFTNTLYKLLYENEGAWLFYPNQIGKEVEHADDFPNGKVMFLLGTLTTCLSDNMREMESDFGMLPYPKWDEQQEEYISMMQNGSVLTGIPIVIDIEEAMGDISAVIEALASESWRIVTIPFFETALKNTYSRDDIAAQMIDIICGQHDTVKSKLTKNFLYEYSTSCGGAGTIFHSLMGSQSKDFASKYASLESAAQSGLAKLVEEYLKTSEGD